MGRSPAPTRVGAYTINTHYLWERVLACFVCLGLWVRVIRESRLANLEPTIGRICRERMMKMGLRKFWRRGNAQGLTEGDK